MAFTQAEVEYLTSQPLARLATVASDGQPDVVPVAFEFDGTAFWVGGGGEAVLSTQKVRNVVDGNRQVAMVIDDMLSFDRSSREASVCTEPQPLPSSEMGS